MTTLMAFIIGVLQITILDLTLSGDNIGVIALATKDLSPKFAKKASFIGISGAIGLRVLFACIITQIMAIQWLPIKLVGGLVLVKITWDFIKPQSKEAECDVKKTDKFWGAVAVIVIADISMSLDNVIAIASTADGNVLLIVIGILINIPIIFYGSQFVANLMKDHPIVIFIGGAILAHTSFKMILEDNITIKYLSLPNIVSVIIPWVFAIGILLYGYLVIKKLKKGKIPYGVEF
ncbi:YjbE family putative metal transport protein [Clostridium estertheticum]|uniref:YjbE family putative metal transport protein n=1 Tax=Clostridium estertheticum TaxID=238834 RepID=UPI001C0BC0F1|nr:YjbE family putative metal transport protein [Clostridium estertheticum]MBU3216107.1 YjbE family putative metal transport protein [Clostridium estertheticum]WAG55908.1 YjbE family putative metal transport protein [Clostridium estertheticum]